MRPGAAQAERNVEAEGAAKRTLEEDARSVTERSVALVHDARPAVAHVGPGTGKERTDTRRQQGGKGDTRVVYHLR